MADRDHQAADASFAGFPSTRPRLRAPRAAAIAGIVFSVLLIASFVLLRRSVPADPLEAGAWLVVSLYILVANLRTAR